MKVCVETHQAKGFGEIPEGTLWDDDSPYLEDASKFADVIDPDAEKPKPVKAAAKKKES